MTGDEELDPDFGRLAEDRVHYWDTHGEVCRTQALRGEVWRQPRGTGDAVAKFDHQGICRAIERVGDEVIPNI